MTIGQRMREAREAAGLSLRAVATQLDGLDHTALSRIENGERRVSSHELFDLAEALRTTTGHLLGLPGRSPALAMAARLGAEVRPEFLDRAVDRVTQVLEMDDLLVRVSGPRPVGPTRPAVEVQAGGGPRAQGQRLAAATREALGLGVGPVADLPALLEDRFGVHVLLEPVAGDVHGLCVADDEVAVVLINSADRWGRQRFTAAHELCHLLANDLELYEVTASSAAPPTNEKRADAFAANFLAPDEGVRQFVAGRPVDAAVVAELMDYFEISLEAMCWRLVDTGFLTREGADEMRAAGVHAVAAAASLVGAFGRRARDAEGARVPPGRLLRRAITAYGEGEVGVGVVAAVLGEADLGAVRQRLDEAGVRPPIAARDGAELV
jgi:Zn-dependent peptidase ImmA (M78 family)/transcriptional regulator with XRE-family HTH domain